MKRAYDVALRGAPIEFDRCFKRALRGNSDEGVQVGIKAFDRFETGPGRIERGDLARPDPRREVPCAQPCKLAVFFGPNHSDQPDAFCGSCVVCSC